MNFFTILRESHGNTCAKELRDLEHLERKRARQRNHLRFNLRCRDEGITPPSLNIKNPIPTKNAERIIKRVRMTLIKERIRCTTNKINNLNTELEKRMIDFKLHFPLGNKMEEDMEEHLKNIHEKEFTKTKRRHIEKLHKLTSKREKQKYKDIEVTDRWICNLSKHTLTEAERSTLTRGLNFAITPKNIPHEEFILATELACEKIKDQGQKAALRNEIAGILKTAKLPPSNITKKEAQAIKTLSKNSSITILPADKGRTTVIMDTEQYEKQMNEMLMDNNTYEILKKDPTEDKKRKLKTLIKPLLNDNKIDKQTYNHLIPTASIIPRIYGTPKIHKPGAPLRPIVDSIGSVTYNLSKTLTEILKPILGQTDHHCKNSKQLAQELKDITVKEDEIFISHDVVSLFTKTPVEATLNIVENRLSTDRTLKKRTKLTTQDISQLLHFIATSTYFQFREKIYKQKEGFAMGDPLSAIMCGFFMEDLETRAITTAPEHCRPTLWKRYVDDILEKIKTGQTQELTKHLNTMDKTGQIKFTHEEEAEKSIAFLDIKIHHTDEGNIKINIYRKPTHTDQYLLWTSEHPITHKLSVARTLFDRAGTITEEEDRKEEEEHIQEALKKCQYPLWAINKGKQQVERREKNKQQQQPKRKNKTENRGVVTLPYIRGITERIQRTMKKYHISTPVKPHIKLRQLLVHPKDKIQPNNKCNVIYEIPCLSCNKTYIGETGRSFSTRKTEHQKECEKETGQRQTRSQKEKAQQENLKSAISDHCKRENHIMDWEEARVIRTEDNRYQRWIMEAVEIKKRAQRTMNRDEGAYMLSHTWSAVLEERPDSRRRGRPVKSDGLTTPL